MCENTPFVIEGDGDNRVAMMSLENTMRLFDAYKFKDRMDFDLLWCTDFLCLLALAKGGFKGKCGCGKDVEFVPPSKEELRSFIDNVALPLVKRINNPVSEWTQAVNGAMTKDVKTLFPAD